MGNKQTF